jgi:diadenosine tetraphosphate (Ap4A) HIT family hydrolase
VDDDCPICAENQAQEQEEDPFSIASLSTGYVRLNHCQYFPGSVFFVARDHVHEAHHLDAETRQRHCDELTEVLRAVEAATSPDKLNVESLGNSVPHLHWWITPRRRTDPKPGAPIWEDAEFLRALHAGQLVCSDQEFREVRQKLASILGPRDLTESEHASGG